MTGETKTGAEVLVDCLIEQGVTTAFGVPGESYLAVLDALYGVGGRIRLIPNRHEGGAAFMAEAWGKLTGEAGIAFVTRGPGATNAAIGVHTAMQGSTPMILFVGQVGTAMKGREAFQELDYRAAFGPLAKWATEIESADRVAEIAARAFSVACTGRPGPVVVALPENVLTARTNNPAGPRVKVPRAGPAPDALAALARMLEGAARPLVIAGGGGWSEQGRGDLRRFLEANALPCLTAWRCQDLVAHDGAAYVGDAGLGKAAHVHALIRDADVVLALNVRLGENTTDGYELFRVPRPEQRLIHVHASGDELNKVYSADVAVLAHPDLMAAALAELPLRPGGDWALRTREARAAHLASLATPPQPGALDMGGVVRWLDAHLPQDAIVTNGAGNFAIWPNKHLPFRGRRRLIAPQSGAMGYGLPAGIAAKIAHPERTVVAFAGDGDFQMTLQELGTACQAGACPIVLVVNNRSYGTIRMHQERTYPGRVSFTDLENPDFVRLAEAYGLHAERVTRTEAFGPAFGRAVAAARGALLELVIDTESLTPRQTLSAMRAAALKG